MTASSSPARPSTVEETIATIRERCQPLAVESTNLQDALGRTLRQAVQADADQPPFDRSAMDGYAVRLDDSAEQFRVVARIRAGDWKPRDLQLGEAVQIATGGALPGDGLQVVMKENVRLENGTVFIVERDSERHIRFRGDDARAGQVLIEPGTTLTAGALALMASVGCVKPSVTRLPSVLHVATGNEIVAPEQTPAHGQIRDSNSTLVRAFLAAFGIEPLQVRLPEDRAAVRSAFRGPPSGLVLVSGGASVGEHDFTCEMLQEIGYTIHIRRTTTRPGKPLIFASNEQGVAFGLPGNPLAHFVCLNLYVRQALWRFSGGRIAPDFREGILVESFQTDANRRETLWPACVEMVGSEARVTPLPWKSSGDLTALARANALLRVAPNQGALSPGARLPFLST